MACGGFGSSVYQKWVSASGVNGVLTSKHGVAASHYVCAQKAANQQRMRSHPCSMLHDHVAQAYNDSQNGMAAQAAERPTKSPDDLGRGSVSRRVAIVTQNGASGRSRVVHGNCKHAASDGPWSC